MYLSIFITKKMEFWVKKEYWFWTRKPLEKSVYFGGIYIIKEGNQETCTKIKCLKYNSKSAKGSDKCLTN